MSDLSTTLRDALAGRYAVERELGRGGMATVFLAQDLKHHRPVAIKVLHPELAAALGADRFLREIEIAAGLQHPHILPLYDSGSAAGFLYYVMPFVEGESLRDRLDRERQLSLEDALKITTEAAGALAYAHSHGVVHRDIKPENILLSGGTAVVADFGIARAISAADQQHLTQTGTVIGTPAYMSPEQATGSAEIDGRSDQYSLACVLYEMLVGEPPFTGATPQAVMARHSLDQVSPPTIVRNTIPDGVEDAILRALAKVPADRFPTTALLAEALLRPSRATGPQRRRTTAAGAGVRHWRVVPRGALLAVGVAVLAAGAWAAVSWVRGRRGGAGPEAAGLDPRRVAVLYFEDRTGKKDLRYLGDGLTEALIHELSGVRQLEVVSANGVRPFRDAPVSPDSLRRALKVGTIVQGTIVQGGDSLQLDVALINAANGREIGSTRLRKARADLFALQDALATSVSGFLRQAIGEEIQLMETRAGTDNEAAWELVEQARELARDVDNLLVRGDSLGASRRLAQADSILARAVTMDRKWAEPIIQRGWVAFATRRLAGFNRTVGQEWIQRGLTYADQALRLKPDDPRALELRGVMRFFTSILNLDPAPLTSRQLLAAAEADLRAGTAPENPNRARAWFYLSALYLRTSKTTEAKLAAQSAIEDDPYLTEAPALFWRLFQSSLDLDDAVESAKWCRQGYAQFPKNPWFTECQIELNTLEGQKPDIKRAWQLLKENVSLYPPTDTAYRRRRGEFLVAMAIARAGLADSARAVALRARTDDPKIDPTHEFAYIEMLLRNLLGDRNEALDRLALFLATNPQERSNVAKDSTWWVRGLRDDPRFKQLVGLAR